MGNWKKVKKALANDSKVECDPDFSSTYHLADGPVSVRWKNDWRGHHPPFLQTLVCLKEVWLALQAMWHRAI
jgi:hypothetical protein